MTEHNEHQIFKTDEIPYQEISDPAVLSKNPIVSVKMITYNHEAYIAQAIEGVLMQETNFPIELIIGEDCSTDRTRGIVLDYQKKYPSVIRVIAWDKNVGMHANGQRTSGACRGKYIAICEGDDYWINPYKLQKQVDFLDGNQDYSFVFTPARVQYQDASVPSKIRNTYAQSTIEKINLDWVLINGGAFFPTASILFKSKILNCDSSNWLNLHYTGDYPLAILAVLNGKIGYLKDVTCVYRVQSISSVTNKKYKTKCDCRNSADKKFSMNLKFINFIESEIKLKRNIVKALYAKENYIKLSKYLDCGLYTRAMSLSFNQKLTLRYFIRIWTKLFYVLIVRQGIPIKIEGK